MGSGGRHTDDLSLSLSIYNNHQKLILSKMAVGDTDEYDNDDEDGDGHDGGHNDDDHDVWKQVLRYCGIAVLQS